RLAPALRVVIELDVQVRANVLPEARERLPSANRSRRGRARSSRFPLDWAQPSVLGRGRPRRGVIDVRKATFRPDRSSDRDEAFHLFVDATHTTEIRRAVGGQRDALSVF